MVKEIRADVKMLVEINAGHEAGIFRLFFNVFICGLRVLFACGGV